MPFNLSPYNVLLNNVSESRRDNVVQVVDYGAGPIFPSNYDLIVSGTAEKAQLNPDFYTKKSITEPRYDGVELTSADYNNLYGS